MTGIDDFQQNVPYPRLLDAPNAEQGFSSLVNGIVPRANMRFANAAARTAALPNPVAGMETYLIAEGRKEIYDGTAWRVYVPQGSWVDWTPEWILANGAMGTSTSAGRYRRTGTTIELEAKLTCGAGSSLGDGYVAFRLPVPANAPPTLPATAKARAATSTAPAPPGTP